MSHAPHARSAGGRLALGLAAVLALSGMGRPSLSPPPEEGPAAEATPGAPAAAPSLPATTDWAGLLGLLDAYDAVRMSPQPAAARALAERAESFAAAAGGRLGERARVVAAEGWALAGEAGRAAEAYRRVARNHPLIGDYAYWRLAQLEPPQAQEHYAALAAGYPGSVLAAEAKVAAARRVADPAARRKALQALAGPEDAAPVAEGALYELATTAGPGQAAAALAYWDRFPEGERLGAVLKALGALPGLDAETRYRLGSHAYFASDYGPAIRYFESVGSAMALYRAGRSHWGLGDLDRAVATLKAALAKDAGLGARVWLTIGQIEAQRGNKEAAKNAYRTAAGKGGDAGVTARYKLSRLYRDAGSPASAEAEERWILANAPWSEEATTLGWDGFWNAYRGGNTDAALVFGARLAQHQGTTPTGQAAQFWMGRIREGRGDAAGAKGHYDRLVAQSPTSYYGYRAKGRLAALAGGTDPGFDTLPGRALAIRRWNEAELLGADERAGLPEAGLPLPAGLAELPQGVKELLMLRQTEAAERWVARSGSANAKAWVAARALDYQRSIRLEAGEPYLAYPLGFAPSLLSAASDNGLDPALLAGLVREESRYNPAIRSWVGATGLAQLMPATAEWVVKQVPEAAGRPLTDPDANLRLGAWYLAYAHKSTGDSMHAVAAYNGGPGAVASWKRKFSADPDVFVEQIPYPETRNYVKKVFASAWNYARLYGR